MKKHVSVTLALIAFGGLVSLYFGCANQPASNSNTNMVALASPEPTPDKAAIETELTRIENDWPRILKEHDADAVKRLEADDIFLVYPDGSSGSKEIDVKDIESAALTADSWEISELTVNVLDNDCAVVRLRTTVKGGKYKAPNGQSKNISGQYRSVDTFRRRNGQWQLVASATVPLLNPEAAATASPAAKATPMTKQSPAAKASPAAKPSPRAIASPARTKTP
jgi:hypothetical protein